MRAWLGTGAHGHQDLCKKSQGQPWPKSLQCLEADSGLMGLRGCGEQGQERRRWAWRVVGWGAGGSFTKAENSLRAAGAWGRGRDAIQAASGASYLWPWERHGPTGPAGSRGWSGPRLLLSAEIWPPVLPLELPLLESPLLRPLILR